MTGRHWRATRNWRTGQQIHRAALDGDTDRYLELTRQKDVAGRPACTQRGQADPSTNPLSGWSPIADVEYPPDPDWLTLGPIVPLPLWGWLTGAAGLFAVALFVLWAATR